MLMESWEAQGRILSETLPILPPVELTYLYKFHYSLRSHRLQGQKGSEINPTPLAKHLMTGFQYNPDRGAYKGVFGAQAIFEITHIGKMRQFRIVAVDHEGGRVAAHLGAIIQPE